MSRSVRRLVQLYGGSLRQWALLVSQYAPAHFARVAFLRALGARIGPRVRIHFGGEFRNPRALEIGPSTIIGWKCILDARGGLRIGSSANLSSEAAIWSATHDPQSDDFGGRSAPVYIGDRVWLGFRSVILPGVHVGEGSVVGACSVVTSDVQPFSIVAGAPAKVIGQRNRNIKYDLGDFDGFLRFI